MGLTASASHAAVVETFTPTGPIASIDAQGDADNTKLNYTSTAGPYTLDRLIIPAATIQEVTTGTYASDAAIRVTSGTTVIGTLNPFSTGDYTGSTSLTAPYILNVTNVPVTAGQVFNFEFFEFDPQDGPANVAEQNFTAFSVQFDSFVAPVPVTLGMLSGASSVNGTLAAGQVAFYRITLSQPISAASFLDITTNGSTGIVDTEIGLYTVGGTFIATDDDDGIASLSALTFGGGSGQDLDGTGTAPVSNGRDGANLAAGDYYVAVGAYNTTFGTTLGSDFSGVSSTSTATGSYTLNFNTTPVPEPTTVSLAALAAAGLVIAHRRRRA